MDFHDIKESRHFKNLVHCRSQRRKGTSAAMAFHAFHGRKKDPQTRTAGERQICAVQNDAAGVRGKNSIQRLFKSIHRERIQMAVQGQNNGCSKIQDGNIQFRQAHGMTSLINRARQGGDVFLWTARGSAPQSEFAFEIRATPFMMCLMKTTLLCILLAVAPLQASDLWSTDYTASTAQAAADKKPVLLEFTGSDWCPPCMKQNKDVFEQAAFEDFAKDKLVLVKLDFPRGKPQAPEIKQRNQELAAKYEVEGFPTVILLGADGKELARQVGYGGGGVPAFIEWVNKNLK